MTARLTWAKLALYCVAFYALWTLREFFVRQEVISLLGNWGGALVNTGVKLLVWTLPAMLLVRHYRDDMAVPNPMRRPLGWRRTLLCAAGFAAYNIAGGLIIHGRIGIHPSFDPVSLIGTVLFVGITEEAVFRGFLLNALLTRTKPRTALIISSALFVLIHFPIWITKGVFASPLTVLRSSLTIFCLGGIFGYFFIKEESLLPPILLHMLWNLLVIVLIGS